MTYYINSHVNTNFLKIFDVNDINKYLNKIMTMISVSEKHKRMQNLI